MEKFSIAGTRPKACRPKKLTAVADRVGQQDADAFALGRAARDMPAQHQRAEDQPAVGHRLAVDVLQHRLPGRRARRARPAARRTGVAMSLVSNIIWLIRS